LSSRAILSGALLLALSWFIVFVGAQVVLLRVCAIRSRARAICRLFGLVLAGEGISSVVLWSLGAERSMPLGAAMTPVLMGWIAMLSLFVLYMPFYYVVVASISVQTVIVIARSAGHGVPLAELEDRFASESILTHRLASMVQSGVLRAEGDAFRLTAKGRSVARAFAAIKELWRLGPGG